MRRLRAVVPVGSWNLDHSGPFFLPNLPSREEHSLENARTILTRLGLDWDEVDARIVRVCCDTISSRSARLCAAALAAIADRIRTNRRMERLKTTVGVDGTVYKKHPK